MGWMLADHQERHSVFDFESRVQTDLPSSLRNINSGFTQELGWEWRIYSWCKSRMPWSCQGLGIKWILKALRFQNLFFLTVLLMHAFTQPNSPSKRKWMFALLCSIQSQYVSEEIYLIIVGQFTIQYVQGNFGKVPTSSFQDDVELRGILRWQVNVRHRKNLWGLTVVPGSCGRKMLIEQARTHC